MDSAATFAAAKVLACMVTSNRQPEPTLAQLLEAERKARERYERLVGYPEDIRGAAHAIWKEAAEATRTHRESCRCQRS